MNLMQLLGMILHVDKTFGLLIANYGTLIYGVLFAIVFCETGLVVFPFLPGDTLLFIGGAFCATGDLSLWLLVVLLIGAAVLGNTVNYWIGSAIGDKVFTRNYRWLDRNALQKTHAFYEHHGGKTIILSRFVPVVRTFAPFVAGVSKMSFGRFQAYNVGGAVLWVGVLVTAGFFFGNIPWIKNNLNVIVLVGVAAAAGPVLLGALWKTVRRLAG